MDFSMLRQTAIIDNDRQGKLPENVAIQNNLLVGLTQLLDKGFLTVIHQEVIFLPGIVRLAGDLAENRNL